MQPDFTRPDIPFSEGDRVVTAERLTLPEGMEEMHDLLAEKPGVVISMKVYEITVEGEDRTIPLATCKVRLDAYPDHELTFHPDELEAADAA